MTDYLDIKHEPVMLSEVISILNPIDGGVYLDMTFGAGGYTKAILSHAQCKVIAVDQDPDVRVFVDSVTKEFSTERFSFYHSKFSDIKSIMLSASLAKVDGIVCDLGVSSMQILSRYRGFSFSHDSELDMRMDTTENTQTAKDIVNKMPEQELANILFNYGDETNSRKIAKLIVEARKIKPITTTTELAAIVRRAFPPRAFRKIDFATKTFQALRIFVNEELKELEYIMNVVPEILRQDCMFIAVSFHSLEDRIVKMALKKKELWQVTNKKPLRPTSAEIYRNNKARSATLRAAKLIKEEATI